MRPNEGAADNGTAGKGAEAVADVIAGYLLRGLHDLTRDPARLAMIERLLV